jgi:hypothetical protein
MSHTDVSSSALNHDLLKQAQTRVEKTAAPSAPAARIANALAARAADATKTLSGAAKPVAAAGAALPAAAAAPKAPQPVARIVDALRTRADDVSKQMSGLYKPDAVPYQDSIMANIRKPGYAGMPNYAELYGPGPYGPHVKTSAYGAYADWTPQQFGSLVGDQMGKDAGAVAPKSLPVEALKMVGKAVYHTPRSLKTLAAGGAGGYALGHSAGTTAGMEQGKAEAAKNLAERLLGQPAAGVKTAGPILNKAALLLGPQNDPISKTLGISGGVGGMLRNMNQGPDAPIMNPIQQTPAAAPAPAPTPAPASPLPAGTGQGGIMGGGGPLSMSLAGKQAGAINELLSEFGGRAAQGLKTHARPMLDKAVSGLQTYGKRMMGDSTLKPLYQRADLISDMTNKFDFPTTGLGARVGSGPRGVAFGNYHNLLNHGLEASEAIAKERDAIDLTRNLTAGGAAAGTLGAIGLAARNNNKQASLTEGLVAGVPMGLAGAGAGLGAGGLYGLLSGAYEAKKGKKLKGALGGMLRGAGGGALVGGGIGAGAGFGGGLMMPNVLTTNPIMQAVHGANLAINPIGNAAKMTAGGIAGGVIGGRLANSQRKKMQDSKPTNNKKDDTDEGEDANDDEQIKSKAAAVKAALLDGALIGGGLGAATAPKGHVAENIGRGMVRGAGTELGAAVGAPLGGVAGAAGGGAVGGAAGGVGGAAAGALLAALTRKPMAAGALKGLTGGATLGGFSGVVGGGVGGTAAGLYHGGRAGYDAAGKLMGPATYKAAVFMGKSTQGVRGLVGKGVLGLTGLAGLGAGKPLVSLQQGLNSVGRTGGEAAAEIAKRIDNFNYNNASPFDVIGGLLPGAQRYDDVGEQLYTGLKYPAGHFMSKHREPAKNVAERLLRMFETPGTREFGK